MTLRPIGLASITLIVGLTLIGCSGEAAPTEPVSSPSASPSSAPVEEPEVEEYDVISCQTIVTQPTLDEFEARGFVLDDEYESTVRNQGSAEQYFFDFGGVACLWVLPNSDTFAPFGYSEITAADATSVQGELAASGYERSDVDGLIYFATNPGDNALGHFDTFMFDSSAWYHAVDESGIEEIRNAVGGLNLQD